MKAKLETFSYTQDALDFLTLVGKENVINVNTSTDGISTKENNYSTELYEVWYWGDE